MTTELEFIIKDYAMGVDHLDIAYDIMMESLFVLIDRDEIQDAMPTLSEEQKQIVFEVDRVLKTKSSLISKILPSPGSTPQARAEGRWWWFLNEA